jgi:glucose-6-phosphate-specific signal transduction histidine kinase
MFERYYIRWDVLSSVLIFESLLIVGRYFKKDDRERLLVFLESNVAFCLLKSQAHVIRGTKQFGAVNMSFGKGVDEEATGTG